MSKLFVFAGTVRLDENVEDKERLQNHLVTLKQLKNKYDFKH